MSEPPRRVRLTGCEVDLIGQRAVREEGEQSLTALEASLLSYLVEHAGRDVPRSELLAAVWGLPPSASTRAVDFAIARLRVKLGEPNPPRHILTSHGVGYRFAPLDEPGRSAPGGSTVGGAIDLDRRTFHRADGGIVRLTRLDCELLEELGARAGKVVTREALARGIWGVGDHLRTLSTALGRLRAKIEVDPASPSVIENTAGGGLRLNLNAGSTPSQLRPVGGPFVARVETDRALAELRAPGLVSLVGTGGIGKTRLAHHLAEQLAAREPGTELWWCDLTSVVGAPSFLSAVARLLGMAIEEDPVERLGRALARRPPGAVLILDNVEQLPDCAPIIDRWLGAAPSLRILVTSRVALRLGAERLVELSFLTVEASAELFTAWAGGDPQSPLVRRLVERLDCLPLAIELAAARANQFPLEVLLERIGHSLDLLIRRPAGTLTHHSTLRGALDWSWDLLSRHERTALMRCSMFDGPFAIEVGARVVDLPDAQRLIRALEQASVIRRDGARLRLYEGIREYAREKLTFSGAYDQAVARHAEVVLALATPEVEQMLDHHRMERVLPLRDLRHELLAICGRTRGEVRALAALAAGLVLFDDGPSDLCRMVLETAVEEAPDGLRWRLLSLMSDLHRRAGRWELAIRHAQDAVEVARGLDEVSRAHAESTLASTYCWAGRLAEAEQLLVGAVAVLAARGHPAQIFVAGRLADCATGLGQPLVAVARYEDTLRRAAVLGVHPPFASIGGLLVTQLQLGRSDDAAETLKLAAKAAYRVPWRSTDLHYRYYAIRVRLRQGRTRRIDEQLEALHQGCVAAVQPWVGQMVRFEQGMRALLRGELALADTLVSDGHGRLVGTPNSTARIASALGSIRVLQGDPEAASDLLTPLLDQPLRSVDGVNLLTTLVAALAEGDQPDRAMAPLETARRIADPLLVASRSQLALAEAAVGCALARCEPGAAASRRHLASARLLVEGMRPGSGPASADRVSELVPLWLIVDRALERVGGG